jgi:uncharacterized repeat protein (TIGR01451 family)
VSIQVRVLAVAPASENLVYHIRVENRSKAPAHHVLVRNPVPANARFVKADPPPNILKPELRWRLGTMHPGDCRTIILVLKPTSGKELKNCARVQFEHGQCVCTRLGPPGLPPPGRPPVKTGRARLGLRKTGPKTRYANIPATYLITVTNRGRMPVDNVIITDPLPRGTTFVRASHGGQLLENTVQWQVGPLDPGVSKTVQLTLKAAEAGEVRNQATAAAEEGPPVQAEAVTRFKGVSALLVEVVDTDDPVEVGAETSYVITVTNQGSVPATNIRITALVPPEMTLTRARGPADNKLGKAIPEGQILIYEPLKALAPGATVKYEVFVKAKTPGDARFQVEVTADQLKAGGPVHEEESTFVYEDVGPMQSRLFRGERFFWLKRKR